MKAALTSLGCRLNQAEIEELGRRLSRLGAEIVPPDGEADVYIVNTCTVTHIADRKSRNLIRRLKREHPRSLVLATGCYAERAPEELRRAGADLVIGNKEKEEIPLRISDIFDLRDEEALKSPPRLRTRAFIKIQDGCDQFCSYCIVPFVRGRERDVPPQKIIATIREREAEGYKEVVLTGTQIGSYRTEGGLAHLLRRILKETRIPRIRLSSIHPQSLTEELLSLWEDRRLCRHLHIPLQSGSDAILRKMRRPYTTDQFRKAVELARSLIPDLAITTDVMVGFPGEGEREFEESLAFCREMKFASIHTFIFSPRPGTAAASMPDDVPYEEKKRRSKLIRELSRSGWLEFAQRFLNGVLDVLWEEREGELWSGYTSNYLRVCARSEREICNEILPAKLLEIRGDRIFGVISK